MTREEASNRLKQWIRNGCDGMTDERLGYIEGWFHKSDKEAFEQAINALEQEPKTGHWIEGEEWEDTDGGWGRWQKCSVCRQSKHHKTKFCPNCGAKMVDEQESEDKE